VRKLGLVLCLAGIPVFAAAATQAVADDTAAPAAAAATAAAAPATPAPTTSDPNKIVCKSLPAPTGTRLGSRRQCLSQAEWDEKERQDQQALMHDQSQGFQMHTGSGN